MSKCIVKLRDRDNAIAYERVLRVMPFGSQAIAIEDEVGTLVLPMARVTEILLVHEEEEDVKIISPDN